VDTRPVFILAKILRYHIEIQNLFGTTKKPGTLSVDSVAHAISEQYEQRFELETVPACGPMAKAERSGRLCIGTAFFLGLECCVLQAYDKYHAKLSLFSIAGHELDLLASPGPRAALQARFRSAVAIGR